MMSMNLYLNFLEFNQMWWEHTTCERFPYLQGSSLPSLLVQRIERKNINKNFFPFIIKFEEFEEKLC